MTKPTPAAPNTPPALPSKPPNAPTAVQQLSSIEWDEFRQLSLKEVTKSAAAWKEGLASIVGTATAGLLLINLPDASGIEPVWRTAVVVVALLAAAAGLVGIWWALSATAGTPSDISREEFEKRYATVEAFRLARGRSAVASLRVARIAVAVSITATVVGAGALWLAPSSAPRLKVQTATGISCGAVESGDQGELHLAVSGERDARVIKLADIQNLWVVNSCGS